RNRSGRPAAGPESGSELRQAGSGHAGNPVPEVAVGRSGGATQSHRPLPQRGSRPGSGSSARLSGHLARGAARGRTVGPVTAAGGVAPARVQEAQSTAGFREGAQRGTPGVQQPDAARGSAGRTQEEAGEGVDGQVSPLL